MGSSADPDQLASSEANWSGFTVYKGSIYPGSAGQGLKTSLYYNFYCIEVEQIENGWFWWVIWLCALLLFNQPLIALSTKN